MFDFAERRRRLGQRMEEEGVDILFLAPSADLEYLTGIERQLPFFGEASYAHGWVTGAFFRREADPVFVLPRMFVRFDLRDDPDGEVVVISETDDGPAVYERVVRDLGPAAAVAVGDRVWAETVIHLGGIVGHDRLRTGSSLVNELRRVKTAEELAAMERAIATVEHTMAAVAALVVPGVTMADLVEAVEHELKVAGSRCPSFATHIFTGLGDDLDSAPPRPAVTEGTRMFDFGGRRRHAPTSGGPSTASARRLPEIYETVPPRRRPGAPPPSGHLPARSTPRVESRRRRILGEHSGTGWGTASAWTSTSARSSRPRTNALRVMTFTDGRRSSSRPLHVRIEDIVVRRAADAGSTPAPPHSSRTVSQRITGDTAVTSTLYVAL